MKQLINFLTVTNNITGVSFVSLRNYLSSSSGELSNVIINVGKDLYKNAMAKDLKAIQNASLTELYKQFQAKGNNISLEVFEQGFITVYNSVVAIGGKNFDGTEKVQSARSKAQGEAYEKINSSLKVHKTNNALYIHGLVVKKEVLVEGDHKTGRKRDKTICQDFIKKTLEFKSNKFRNYIVQGADVLNLAKTSFEGSDLAIEL